MKRQALEKMGLRPDMRTRLWRLPPELSMRFEAALAAQGDPADWQVGFVMDAAAIADAAREFRADLSDRRSPVARLPEKSGPIRTDISRDRGWEPIAALGLLGVAQISVDYTSLH